MNPADIRVAAPEGIRRFLANKDIVMYVDIDRLHALNIRFCFYRFNNLSLPITV